MASQVNIPSARLYYNGQTVGVAGDVAFEFPDPPQPGLFSELPIIRIGRMIQSIPPQPAPLSWLNEAVGAQTPAVIPAVQVEDWLQQIMEGVNKLEMRYAFLVGYLSLPPQAAELLAAAMNNPRHKDILSVLADYLEDQQHEAANRVRKLAAAPDGE